MVCKLVIDEKVGSSNPGEDVIHFRYVDSKSLSIEQFRMRC